MKLFIIIAALVATAAQSATTCYKITNDGGDLYPYRVYYKKEGQTFYRDVELFLNLERHGECPYQEFMAETMNEAKAFVQGVNDMGVDRWHAAEKGKQRRCLERVKAKEAREVKRPKPKPPEKKKIEIELCMEGK